MDLRKTHSHPYLFDAFLVAVAFFGLAVAFLTLRAGGVWGILGVLALIGEALLIWGMFVEPHQVKVVTYREKLRPDAQAWVKIVFLSDFHAGSFHSKRCYERIVNEVRALHPHLLLLGGDFVTDRFEPVMDLENLKGLEAPLGRYFVLGNHDYLDRPQEVRKAIRLLGYEDLTNKSVDLTLLGRKLELRGVDDNWYGKPEIFHRSSREVPHLTLAHEPDVLLDLKEGETDLVLAGHTHSGQVRLPFVGALIPIPAILGRAVDRGRKVVNGVPCIISNGLGESDGRMRLFSPPQIVVVEVGI
ncbi:metallophosphoesterase [Candidatus Uhrbacteria bacterium]|nr:metallophosphoesterase [Candidatus Uhrbacteria bacterium]